MPPGGILVPILEVIGKIPTLKTQKKPKSFHRHLDFSTYPDPASLVESSRQLLQHDLQAPVGPPDKSALAQVQNLPDDVRLIQRILNLFVVKDFPDLMETGQFDRETEFALRVVKHGGFSGLAGDRVLPESPFFEFLRQVALASLRWRRIGKEASPDVLGLAYVMVPGGRSHARPRDADTPRTADNIHAYLPLILEELVDRKLDDVDMLMVALGTIRAETSTFAAIDEEISPFNTSPGGRGFGLYDGRKQLGNLGPPDGSSYHGRGFVQLTGRENYARLGRELHRGNELLDEPDKANRPRLAAEILAQFLKDGEGRIRDALKKRDLLYARSVVNGGDHGWRQFAQAFDLGRQYLRARIVPQANRIAQYT